MTVAIPAVVKDFTTQNSNIFSRISRYLKLNYSRKAVHCIADKLSKALQNMPRLQSAEALKHRSVKATRTFFKKVNPHYKTDKKVQACYRQYLAAKVGVHAEAFDKNCGLETFVKESRLEQYLEVYDDKLEEEADHTIKIKYQGTYQKWEHVKQEYDKISFPKPVNPFSPKCKWSYGQDGVKKADMYSWAEWKPFMKRPNPTGKYFFEYCAICEEASLRSSGDHTWFRLITPDGDVYSIGKNLDAKLGNGSAFQLPLRKRKGYLQSPEISEFWPAPVYTLPVEITEEDFKKIKASVEEDKKNEKELDLQVLKENCLHYVNAKAAIAGLKIPTSYNILRLVTPIFLQNIVDVAFAILPKIVVKVLQVVGAFFTNLILLALGNGSVDKSLKNRVRTRPQLNSFFDLFNPEKLKFHPPTYVAQQVFPKIEEWRKKEMLKHPERADQIRFSLPG